MLRNMCWLCAAVFAATSVVRAGDDEIKNVDQIIKKYIEAIGGRAKLDSVKSMRWTGKSMFQGGMEAPLTMEFKRPGKLRIDFTFQGMTGTQAFDGETGWGIMPFMGKTDPEKMSADQVKQIKDQADMDGPLVDYAKKGHKVENMGLDDIEGTSAYKLKVTRKDGEVEYHFLDKEYFIPVAIKRKHKFQGTEIGFEVLMSDYKEVSGVMYPHSVKQRAGSGPGGSTLTIDKIEVNVDLPDARFAMPEVKKDTPKAAEKEGDE